MDNRHGDAGTAPSTDSFDRGGGSMREANRRAIADFIAAGAVEKGTGRVGVELEHIITREDGGAVSYSEPDGIRSILEELAPAYTGRTYSEGFLIGLERADSTITIEPAGQLEISVSPYGGIACVQKAYDDFRRRLDPMLARRGMRATALGYHPTAHAADLELIPKERYRLMDRWFRHTGSHGICMMRGSASTQVSLDFTSEEDAIEKFKMANLLGPLFSFITDNAPVFEGATGTGRMARTRIWNDVDPERSMVVPHLFEEGFDTPYTYLDYADHILDSHPILIADGESSRSTGDKTAAEFYSDCVMDEEETDHLISMFFPDVRLKRYIEIRMADSLPEAEALAYTALVKGVLYSRENREELARRFRAAGLDDGSIPAAKASLMEDAWLADVYGTRAYVWLDDLLAMAWRGLPEEERHYLAPMESLIEKRTTLFDESDLQPRTVVGGEAAMEDEYRGIVETLDGDEEGRISSNRALLSSTAYYHGEIIQYGYVPMLLPPARDSAYARACSTMHGILVKMIRRYLEDPGYRRLFAFTPELESAILSETGYEQDLPICRFDIFPDIRADAYPDGDVPFRFCEVNTDGTSTMNEDRELTASIIPTPSCREMARRWTLAPQSLFDPLVRMVARCYGQWLEGRAQTHPRIPRVAIIDFAESATSCEFQEFERRFRLHGMACSIPDIRSLRHEGGFLVDGDGEVIDCVYRRAVTSEVFDHLEETRPFVEAVAAGDVCCVGAFRTQIPHCKRSFAVLRDPATQSFLSDAEKLFVERHVPRTYLLDGTRADVEEIIADKDRWIIKPDDGYGTHGVSAGCVCGQKEWEKLVRDAASGGGFIVQEYSGQHSSPNILGRLADADRVSDEEKRWFELNSMPGLFVYDGGYAGAYSRNGRQGIIGSPWDTETRAVFHVTPKH